MGKFSNLHYCTFKSGSESLLLLLSFLIPVSTFSLYFQGLKKAAVMFHLWYLILLCPYHQKYFYEQGFVENCVSGTLLANIN